MVKKKNSRFQKNVDPDADVDDVNPDSSKYIYDEIDHFHANRRGIDLSNKSGTQIKTKKIKFEMPVLPANDDENYDYENDEDGNFDDGDYEENNEVISSNKAWGKKASAYFGAEDVKAVRGKEREELEDAEEEEAMKIQQRLAEEIDEDQFEIFQLATEAEEEKSESQTEKVDIDIQSLSLKAQWKLVKQESPELRDLITDFKAKAKDLKKILIPLLNLVKSGKISGNGAIYVQTRFNIYLTYLLNISFYISIKAKRESLTGHPIVGRLVQYRSLIHKLSRLDKKLENDVITILNNQTTIEQTSDGDDEKELDDDYDGDDEDVSRDIDEELPPLKKQKLNVNMNEESFIPLNKRLAQEEERKKKLEKTQEPIKKVAKDEKRREATAPIKKNKGFTIKSKKRLGNPRVRNKEKFRKAKIRRKGQVRDYRPELDKYSGEATGIKAGLVRSRPIL